RYFSSVDSNASGQVPFERVLNFDVCPPSTYSLRLRDYVHRHRRLAGHLRPEDLGDPASRNAASQRHIKRQGTRWYRLDRHLRGGFPQSHNGASAELLLDLADREVECAQALVSLARVGLAHCRRPIVSPHGSL